MGAVASARPMIALKLTAAIVSHDANGAEKLAPINGNVVLKPGDIVRYDIAANNGGDRPATGVRPLDQIPAGTTFVANSASGNGKVEYSLDHGKTWSAVPTIVVHEASGDKTVKADPATYTAIRWTANDAIKAGASSHFAFAVAVK